MYDCPLGSDEINCSCDAWNMKSCHISGTDLCIYHEWLGEDINSNSCLGLIENQAIDGTIEIEECMEYGKPDKEKNVKTTTYSSFIPTRNDTNNGHTTMVQTTEDLHQTTESIGMDWLELCTHQIFGAPKLCLTGTPTVWNFKVCGHLKLTITPQICLISTKFLLINVKIIMNF